ncbi:MAG: glycosyltransferase family 9 protein [Deltaproteobacteria bacterium]|nr:glycosyltransferase family 9 protein [Deltaproteobacteria bacterium]
MLVKGRAFSPEGITRILLIQLGDVGDLVLTTPTMKTLRENCPRSEIFVFVREHTRELAEGCPWVDGVISVNKGNRNLREEIAYQRDFLAALRRKRFQLTIDLRAGTRGAIVSYLSGAKVRIGRYSDDGTLWRNRLFTHLIRPENELEQYSSLHSLNILAPLELEVKDTSLALVVTPEKEKSALEILRREKVPSDKPILALHPFSRWRYKEWLTENYIRLINHIGSRYPVAIIVTGAPEERDRVSEIVSGSSADAYNFAGKTSLVELPAVLKKCSLLIGIDSAAMHIAAAVGIPTITIFGPSSPVSWAPRGKKHRIIQKDLLCVPCRQKGCNNSEVSRCLDELEPEEVIPLVEDQLNEILSPL